MAKQLIEDIRKSTATVVKTEKLEDGTRKLTFEAIVSAGDFINQNGRYYPMEVLWSAFEEVNNDLGSYPGAVGHPAWFYNEKDFISNGIIWRGFTKEGNLIKGQGEIIWTEAGKDLAANIEAGVAVGFSTRTWAESEERMVDDQLVEYIISMDPPYVDAVENPSVRTAKLSSYSKEAKDRDRENKETNSMDFEKAYNEAKGQISLLESQNTELKNNLDAQKQATDAVSTELESVQTKNVSLESKVAELESEVSENRLTNKLIKLTEGHQFAATIISESRELGVTLENAEKIVSRVTFLVEKTATASAEAAGAAPKGNLESEEDKPSEPAQPVTEAEDFDEEVLGIAKAIGYRS